MAVSISLLLNSDTDGYGFDQHTDEELRKIEGSSASSHRGVPFLWLNWWSWRPADNAKPVSTADVRRANPSEHADVRSLLWMQIYEKRRGTPVYIDGLQ